MRILILIPVLGFLPFLCSNPVSGVQAASVDGLVCLGACVQPQEQLTQRARHFTIDANLLGVTLGYARKGAKAYMVGGELGVGGDFLNYTPIAGSHLSQLIAFGGRDESDGEAFWEFVHIGGLVRYVGSSRWHHDLGLRGSIYFHWDDSDDDAGAGTFVGAFYFPTWGGERFRLGPRVLAGVFHEGGIATEFGVNVSLVTGRLLLSW